MPYSIDTNNAGCTRGYAVVKDSDGEVMGCHSSRRDARAQIIALTLAEMDAARAESEPAPKPEQRQTYTPTDEMVKEARLGLDWRQTYGRGGTQVGVSRARDIANRRPMSLTTIARMRSFFARHEVDKQAEGFRPGEDGYPSAGRIAWALWGGDPGRAFAERILREIASLQKSDDSR